VTTTYLRELDSRNYIGNVVIRILGQYFSIRQPDSGLVVLPAYNGLVNSVVINPTQIDIRRVSSTISQFSFKLVDQNRSVTGLIEGDASSFIDTDCEIWVGRSDVSMPFQNYFKLPTTRIKKIDYADGQYSFSTQEQTERINRGLFQNATLLDVNILSATSSIDVGPEIANFPDEGYLKIDNEIISYRGRDVFEQRFLRCIRGEFNTVPASHDAGAQVYGLEYVEGNPIDVALKILISGGGGGQYDVLGDGCGLSPTLIDVAGMLELRDAELPQVQIKAFLYQLNGLKWLEDEILTPYALRFTTSDASKLTLKQIDRLKVRPPGTEITNSTIKGSPKWVVDATRIVNQIEVQWDYSESAGKYLHSSTFTDSDSLAKFGPKEKLSFKFKTLRESLQGDQWVKGFADKLLRRLSRPTPEINLTTHIDKSIHGPVDRVKIITDQLPDYDGTLDFASQLEVVSRSINYMNGDVTFRLQFCSNTLNELGFISPSERILEQLSPRMVRLPAGGGAYYVKGWKLRLWRVEPHELVASEPLHTIEDIQGDVLILAEDIQTPITPGGYRLRFPDYSEVSDDQKRFAFISARVISGFGLMSLSSDTPLPDRDEAYVVTFGKLKEAAPDPIGYYFGFRGLEDEAAGVGGFGSLGDESVGGAFISAS
jgi:hypothetical protein